MDFNGPKIKNKLFKNRQNKLKGHIFNNNFDDMSQQFEKKIFQLIQFQRSNERISLDDSLASIDTEEKYRQVNPTEENFFQE
jgi:hypothetical protein